MAILSQKRLGMALIGIALFLFVLLTVLKINIDKQEAFLCNAVHATPTLNMAECPAHESPTSWLFVAAFGISFVLLASGFYLAIVPPPHEEKIPFKKIDRSKLDENERKIYDLLVRREGAAYQSDLIKEIGLSKVQTTRLLDRLAAKKVVDRQRRGMTNIVVLK